MTGGQSYAQQPDGKTPFFLLLSPARLGIPGPPSCRTLVPTFSSSSSDYQPQESDATASVTRSAQTPGDSDVRVGPLTCVVCVVLCACVHVSPGGFPLSTVRGSSLTIRSEGCPAMGRCSNADGQSPQLPPHLALTRVYPAMRFDTSKLSLRLI